MDTAPYGLLQTQLQLSCDEQALYQPADCMPFAHRRLFGSKSSSTSSSAAGSTDEETQWRRWVDERLVKTITANIYRNWDESWDTFRYITDQTNWSWGTRELARVSGAVLMWQIGQRMPKKYGLEGDLREALYADLREWLQALGSRRFMGGDKPNLADLAVFGVLRAVEKTPTFNDAVANTHIGGWYVRMSQTVGISSRL
jgi:microsomal prostaglandin-E synthase 2